MADGTQRAIRLAAPGWAAPGDSPGIAELPPHVARQIAPLLALAGHRRRHGEASRAMQRLSDAMLLLATSFLWLPLMGLCWLLVKLEAPDAAALFVQQRTGRGGHRFAMYKIRTMVPDAEARLAEVVHLNQRTWPDFKIERDPRVTRMGAFLRRCHLDELPQLLNVLRGDMSLVGPRPITLPMAAHQPWQRRRFEVAPGLTGLWQVVQDEVYDFDLRVQLDLLYVERCCMRLDLVILARTVGRVLGSMADGRRRERGDDRSH